MFIRLADVESFSRQELEPIEDFKDIIISNGSWVNPRDKGDSASTFIKDQFISFLAERKYIALGYFYFYTTWDVSSRTSKAISSSWLLAEVKTVFLTVNMRWGYNRLYRAVVFPQYTRGFATVGEEFHLPFWARYRLWVFIWRLRVYLAFHWNYLLLRLGCLDFLIDECKLLLVVLDVELHKRY